MNWLVRRVSNELENKCSQYGDLQTDMSMATLTTYKVGGRAKYVFYPSSLVGLIRGLRLMQEAGYPCKLLGKGSNLLASDDDYHGCLVRLDRNFTNCYFEDDGVVYVESGASIIFVSHEAMKHELSGLEFASGIPGTVGGALFMNAGAYKSCMADVVKEVLVYREGRVEWLDVKECNLAYRSSIFQQHRDWIILAIKLQLKVGDGVEIKSLMDSRRERRLASQPLDKPSAGSVFRNPEKIAAWQCIEGVGLRGRRIGGAQVSEKHANFIINVGNAKAEDVRALIEEVQQAVKDKYQIELQPEVEFFNWENNNR